MSSRVCFEVLISRFWLTFFFREPTEYLAGDCLSLGWTSLWAVIGVSCVDISSRQLKVFGHSVRHSHASWDLWLLLILWLPLDSISRQKNSNSNFGGKNLNFFLSVEIAVGDRFVDIKRWSTEYRPPKWEPPWIPSRRNWTALFGEIMFVSENLSNLRNNIWYFLAASIY